MLGPLRGGVLPRARISSEDLPSTSCTLRSAPFFASECRPRRASHRCHAHEAEGQQEEEAPAMPSRYTSALLSMRSGTPLLSPDKVFDRLSDVLHDRAKAHFAAFYSSELGGVTTDPAFVFVHLDDHMIHKGHCVCDTVQISDGYLYRLPQHVRRLISSAEGLGIESPMSEEAMMRILLDTAAASRRINGTVRFWLSAGRGGFGLSAKECIKPGFFAVVTDDSLDPNRLEGWAACISPIPPQQASLAVLKTNNYLPNALVQLDAQSRGFNLGLFVDEDKNILSAANMSVAMVTVDDVLVVPPSDKRLQSLSLQRLIELIPEEAKRSPDDVVIVRVEVRNFGVKDMAAAKEAFAVNAETGVVPIVSIDGALIGEGEVGITALALQALLERDMQPNNGESENHVAVPYGYTTGMRSQLV